MFSSLVLKWYSTWQIERFVNFENYLQSLNLQPSRKINKNMNKYFWEGGGGGGVGGAIQEKERENERREIEVGYSLKSSREGWVTVEREKKRTN